MLMEGVRCTQGMEEDAMSISSRLRDVMIGSEDEMESVLSGPLSDDGRDEAASHGARQHHG